MGAWIEIDKPYVKYGTEAVAPLVGAWIEMDIAFTITFSPTLSHPLWVRGLK